MILVSSIFLYLLSFLAIWYGAGLIIKSIDRISKKLRLSSFAISFILLGVLTTIPEMAVGATSIIRQRPEIFVGNLLGGVVVIFLLIIPLLAVLGNGIKLNHDLDKHNLLKILGMVVLPAVFAIDQKLTNTEGLVTVITYLVVLFFVQRKHGLFDRGPLETFSIKAYSFADLAKVGLGTGMVLFSSQYIVNQTLAFAEILRISPFYISILVLSLGTNIPELSIAIRSIISGKKDIAFGGYLGSAAANAMLLGVLTIINNGEVPTSGNFLITFLFLTGGLALFYFFSQSKKDISRKEGLLLLSLYVAFVAYEIIQSRLG